MNLHRSNRHGSNRHGPVLALVALLALLPLASGCGRAGSPGFVTVQEGALTVDRPTAWSTPMPVEAPWRAGFRLSPTSVEQVQVTGDLGDHVSAAEATGSLVGIGQVGLAGFTVVQTRDLEVPGATSAQSVRYTITDNAGSQVVGEWFVAVRWPEQRSVGVSLLTPRYDPELERQVVDSLRMTAG